MNYQCYFPLFIWYYVDIVENIDIFAEFLTKN